MTMSNLPQRPQASRLKKSATAATIVVGLVGGFEGLRTYVYLDPIGIPTYCFGETRGARLGNVYTPKECETLLLDRLEEDSVAIDRCLNGVIPDKVYVAYLSAAYNIGVDAFCSSSMARNWNAGRAEASCDSLLLWDKVTIGGVKTRLPGLSRRRAEERKLCLSGLGVAA